MKTISKKTKQAIVMTAINHGSIPPLSTSGGGVSVISPVVGGSVVGSTSSGITSN